MKSCENCGKLLEGKQKRWCSKSCFWGFKRTDEEWRNKDLWRSALCNRKKQLNAKIRNSLYEIEDLQTKIGKKRNSIAQMTLMIEDVDKEMKKMKKEKEKPKPKKERAKREFICKKCCESYPITFTATKDVSICRWCSGEA